MSQEVQTRNGEPYPVGTFTIGEDVTLSAPAFRRILSDCDLTNTQAAERLGHPNESLIQAWAGGAVEIPPPVCKTLLSIRSEWMFDGRRPRPARSVAALGQLLESGRACPKDVAEYRLAVLWRIHTLTWNGLLLGQPGASLKAILSTTQAAERTLRGPAGAPKVVR